MGQGVEVVHGGNGLMERGVEDRHLRRTGQHLLDRENAFQIGGVVQRRDLEQRADLPLHIFVDDAALGEEFAAVRHAVTDGFDLVERPDDAVRRIGQRVEYQADAGRVVGNGAVQLEILSSDGFVGEDAVAESDAFDQAFGQQRAAGLLHVDHLVFDRGTAAVEY